MLAVQTVHDTPNGVVTQNFGEILHHGPTPDIDIQAKLREIWADVLQDDPSSFSNEDVFFEVGGDSITAQRLVEAAANEGIHLTMEQIFLNASLEEMAGTACLVDPPERRGFFATEDGALDQNQDPAQLEEVAKKLNLPASSIESAYGLTPLQESLLVDDDGNPNSYVRQFVFRMRPSLESADLQRAWSETIRTSPVLRTRICQLPGRKTLQVVVREDAECALWNAGHAGLDSFLEQDAQMPMLAGDAFFRYAIVGETEKGARYFVWTVHHALVDGASIPEILSDVARRIRNEAVSPRPSYASFIRSPAVSPDPALEQQFWTQALSGTHPTPWPTAPHGVDFRANPSTVLEHHLTLDHLPSFGTTKSLLLRAAWAILLSHYTGTEEVNFGAINNGRTAAVHGVSRMTGPTINLVPIVLNVNPKESVSAFLARIRLQAAEMMPFEHTGPSRIRKFLAVDQSLHTTALDLQSLLVVQPMSFEKAVGPSMEELGLEYVDRLGKKEQHPYPLVLTFTLSMDDVTDTGILLRIEHDEREIPSPQALRLAHHMQAILTRLSQATEDTLLEAIDPLSTHDVQQISKWNASTPPAEETCLHQLFERQVRLQPDATAVCSLSQALTYAEVDAHASSLATQLVELGVAPEDFVGVCFDKSIWTVVAILAVFKAGGIYVPIDPAHPRGRIEEIVRMVRMKVALASPVGAEVLQDIFDSGDMSIITVDNGSQHLPAMNPPRVARPTGMAYLLFTSGSTGKPKGILMSHRAICTSILHHGPAFEAGPHWRTLQFCAHTFDLSVAEFFTTLSFGGCICVPSEEDRTGDLAGAITALRANTLIVVPTVANLIQPAEVPTLERLILSGEPIPKETIVRWADHVNLTCAYGPSETAVWCSANLRVARDAHQSHVGRSLGASMWIVDADDHSKIAAVGCVGEIAISGALLGGGYFGDRATTDAAFVSAPDWMRRLTGDTMLYRSGDLGRYNPDGTFHVVGRRDTQVKLRGLRIELGEIENRLTRGGLVTAALACLPQRGPAARRIVAVVSEHSDLDLGASAVGASAGGGAGGAITYKNRGQSSSLVGRLRERLQISLPEYMVPSVWIVLDKMPLLISGKMDRKRLKLWVDSMSAETYKDLLASDDQVQGEGQEVPPGSLADQLREVWSNVLQVPAAQISMATSFFAIGGDSIAAIQIVSQARRTLPGVPISVRAIINAKTLGNLAAVLSQKKEEEEERGLLERQKDFPTTPKKSSQTGESVLELLESYRPLLTARLDEARTQVRVEDAHLLSAFQREILRARSDNPAVFLMSWRMELWPLNAEPLSLPRLEAAWRSVVARFPVLRSIFLKDAPSRLGLPAVQIVLDARAAAEATIIVSDSPASAPEPRFSDSGVPGVDACFLPHRAHIIRHGERVYLHVEMDHLIIDGWSLGLIKKALLEAYEAGPDRDLDRGDVVASYKAFVAAQQNTERILTDDAYWARLLDGFSPSLLSTKLFNANAVFHHQEQQQYTRQKKVILSFPPIPAVSLTPFGATHGLTPASIFSAAWAQTLSRFTSTRDVAFEYVVSGRDEDEGEEGHQHHSHLGASVWDLVGCCINVLVHRVQGAADAGVAGLAAALQEQSAEGARHGASNVREVAGRLGHARPFDTAVNFQRRPTAVENEARTLRVDDDLTRSVDPWHFDVLVRVLHITDDNTFRPSLEFFEADYSPEAMQKVGQDWWRTVKDLAV